MPFGMKNSSATFRRLINMRITGLDNCEAYIDNSIIYSEELDQQINTIREFFERLSKVKLTINLAKSEFCHAGAGSVLLQEDGNGVDHPVSYFSKKFNKYQKNYSTIEKECQFLSLALQHFEVYLTSSLSPIVVFSDHNPLIFIHKMKNKNQRLLRWSLLLQEYNLDISHIKAKDNITSIALSRA